MPGDFDVSAILSSPRVGCSDPTEAKQEAGAQGEGSPWVIAGARFVKDKVSKMSWTTEVWRILKTCLMSGTARREWCGSTCTRAQQQVQAAKITAQAHILRREGWIIAYTRCRAADQHNLIFATTNFIGGLLK